MINRSLAWRDEVNEIEATGATVSLKTIEGLLENYFGKGPGDGLMIPFEFPEQIEILKNKRLLAKQWLEKLKKSFAGNRTRSAAPRGQDQTNKEEDYFAVKRDNKLRLDDMRVMVAEGELLYDAAEASVNNRELSKAQSVLEAAEEVSGGVLLGLVTL